MGFRLFLIYRLDFYLMSEYHSYFRNNIDLNRKYSYRKKNIGKFSFNTVGKTALFDMQDF